MDPNQFSTLTARRNHLWSFKPSATWPLPSDFRQSPRTRLRIVRFKPFPRPTSLPTLRTRDAPTRGQQWFQQHNFTPRSEHIYVNSGLGLRVSLRESTRSRSQSSWKTGSSQPDPICHVHHHIEDSWVRSFWEPQAWIKISTSSQAFYHSNTCCQLWCMWLSPNRPSAEGGNTDRGHSL